MIAADGMSVRTTTEHSGPWMAKYEVQLQHCESMGSIPIPNLLEAFPFSANALTFGAQAPLWLVSFGVPAKVALWW
jgi:hypothetical protein